METKVININVPDGCEVDEEKSTFTHIVFKKKEEQVKSCREIEVDDLSMSKNNISDYVFFVNNDINYYNKLGHNECSVFATLKQAKSALAMVKISQIITNDKRFGGNISDKEWADNTIDKFIIERHGNKICSVNYNPIYSVLAFHTEEQRALFLQENEDLIKDFLML